MSSFVLVCQTPLEKNTHFLLLCDKVWITSVGMNTFSRLYGLWGLAAAGQWGSCSRWNSRGRTGARKVGRCKAITLLYPFLFPHLVSCIQFIPRWQLWRHIIVSTYLFAQRGDFKWVLLRVCFFFPLITAQLLLCFISYHSQVRDILD